MTESLIGAGAFFHETVKPTVIVEPVEAPFHFPPLTAITGLSALNRRYLGLVVVPSDNTGNNVSFF